MSKTGNLLFAKYAFAPNKLRYCGPGENRAIFDYCVAQQSDQGLVELLQNFEGAFPYLKLIAKTNKIKDSFNEKVVEAYWLGNDLLNQVDISSFHNSIQERFGKKMSSDAMRWLAVKPVVGAKPHHSFHVLDVYTKTGLIRSGIKTNVLETINNCLIMWGKVKKVVSSQSPVISLDIEYNPIIMQNGKLVFGTREIKKVKSNFIQPEVGDRVSFHWGYICDKLDQRQLKNLQFWTNHHLKIANQTI